MITGLFWLIIICLAWAYWPYAIGIFALWLIYIFWSAANQEKQKRLAKARRLTDNFPKYLGYVNDGKTETTRLNNVNQMLSNLDQILALDPRGEAVPNAKELMTLMDACSRTIPVDMALRRADKALFKNQKKGALSAYLDALYAIKKIGTQDADLALCRCRFEDTDAPVTIQAIRERAIASGWDGSTSE